MWCHVHMYIYFSFGAEGDSVAPLYQLCESWPALSLSAQHQSLWWPESDQRRSSIASGNKKSCRTAASNNNNMILNFFCCRWQFPTCDLSNRMKNVLLFNPVIKAVSDVPAGCIRDSQDIQDMDHSTVPAVSVDLIFFWKVNERQRRGKCWQCNWRMIDKARIVSIVLLFILEVKHSYTPCWRWQMRPVI